MKDFVLLFKKYALQSAYQSGGPGTVLYKTSENGPPSIPYPSNFHEILPRRGAAAAKLVGFLPLFIKPLMTRDKPHRILLCDDDPDEALFLNIAFEKAGFLVDLEYFSRCSALLDHLPIRPATPDLIFIDINMPGEYGLDCLESVKRLPEYKNVPVAIYTTSALHRDVDVAFKRGASLFLSKTSSENDLVEMVNWVLTREMKELQYPQKESFWYLPKKALD